MCIDRNVQFTRIRVVPNESRGFFFSKNRIFSIGSDRNSRSRQLHVNNLGLYRKTISRGNFVSARYSTAPTGLMEPSRLACHASWPRIRRIMSAMRHVGLTTVPDGNYQRQRRRTPRRARGFTLRRRTRHIPENRRTSNCRISYHIFDRRTETT